jgi:hypothetical protein
VFFLMLAGCLVSVVDFGVRFYFCWCFGAAVGSCCCMRCGLFMLLRFSCYVLYS